MLPVHDLGMSKNYIVQKGESYWAVVEEDGQAKHEVHITDEELVKKIKALLDIRREAGEKLTELLIENAPLTASAHHQATVALGEGEDRGGND
jgi:hypothetical protein